MFSMTLHAIDGHWDAADHSCSGTGTHRKFTFVSQRASVRLRMLNYCPEQEGFHAKMFLTGGASPP